MFTDKKSRRIAITAAISSDLLFIAACPEIRYSGPYVIQKNASVRAPSPAQLGGCFAKAEMDKGSRRV
jgi:hypothetical protein